MIYISPSFWTTLLLFALFGGVKKVANSYFFITGLKKNASGMNELYENGDEDRPIEPKLNMALGDENIKKAQHSNYVKTLCTLKNMQEMKSVGGRNSQNCRLFVCPNHEKAPSKKSKSRSSESESTTMNVSLSSTGHTTMPPTSSTQPQWCPVELKLTYTLIPNNKVIKKWHVANVCLEHAEFCNYGNGIKNPSTKVINTILRTFKDAKSQEETMDRFKKLGVDTEDKLIKTRITAAMRIPRSQKFSTNAHNTEQSSEVVMSIDDATPIDSMDVDSVVSEFIFLNYYYYYYYYYYYQQGGDH